MAPKEAQYFLTIDLDALNELVDVLLRCYHGAGISEEVPAVLERLRANIADTRWQRKVIYFRAINALLPAWDEAAGRAELKKLEPVAEESDVETLQLYIDLFGEELFFSQKQDLIDQLLRFTKNNVDRLHYRSLRAVEYLSIGDSEKAKSGLEFAISSYKEERSESPSEYEIDQFASAVELLGILKNDDQLLSQAVDLYEKLLSHDSWTAQGKAAICRKLGDTYRSREAWNSARDAYARGIALYDSQILQVFLAESQLHLNDFASAKRTIVNVNTDQLEPSEHVDYVLIFSAIAMRLGVDEMLGAAESMLRSLTISSPYFRERRDALLISVIDTRRSGKANETIPKPHQTLRVLAVAAGKYLKLEPNVFGVGVNIGKMLEEYGKSPPERSKQDKK